MSRWIMVSNRLPFRYTDGELSPSSGGLVTAIQGVHSDARKVWCGVAPDGVSPTTWDQVVHEDQYQYLPVFVPGDLYNHYYNGFCNDVLWPIFHYEPSLSDFANENWEAYRKVNEAFAEKLIEFVQDDDLIWIHDFQLCLLPKLLKAKKPFVRVGFFLHTPFPSSEIFRQLPVRDEFLRGLIEADLVGFQDYSYLRHFSSSVLRILGLDSDFQAIHTDHHRCRLGVFPVGIETEDWAREAAEPAVLERALNIRKTRYSFLGVDRLDYIKGVDLKLKSFARLLERYPEVRGKVRLLQVAVPTREDVPHYQALRQEVNRLVGEINGRFSTSDWTPVRYIYSSVPKQELLSLYRAADALVVSSKRDGMNLVAQEYIASQDASDPGMVLLSEFTGAHSVLSDALVINPWDTEKVADVMKTAFEMSLEERREHFDAHWTYLKDYTSTTWATTFMKELSHTNLSPIRCRPLSLDDANLRDVFFADRRPLTLLLDYDGTLVDIQSRSEDAVLSPELWTKLSELNAHPRMQIVIVSGRNAEFLQKQFRSEFDLAAEHGSLYFDSATGKWTDRVFSFHHRWFDETLEIMRDYSKRVPGSYIERKTYCLAWHYRRANRDYGHYQAMKLLEELEYGLANQPVALLNGKKIIEARPSEAHKGHFASWFLQTHANPAALPVAVGDDTTDEDLFEAVKDTGVSIKVGSHSSRAQFSLKGSREVWLWLDGLKHIFDEELDPGFSGSGDSFGRTPLLD